MMTVGFISGREGQRPLNLLRTVHIGIKDYISQFSNSNFEGNEDDDEDSENEEELPEESRV